MLTLDFGAFGRNAAVDVPVNQIDLRLGNSPILILLSEKHNDNSTITDNVQATVALLDAGIIQLVFVEDWFEGDVRVSVEKECSRLYGCASLHERHHQIRQEYGADEAVFDAMRATTHIKLSFARWVLFLRPNASVICVEDPDLKREADQVAQAIGGEPVQEAEPEAERLRRIAKARKHDVHRRRELAFYTSALHNTPAGTFAVAINAGGHHNSYLIQYADRNGIGCIYTQPVAYTDDLPEG